MKPARRRPGQTARPRTPLSLLVSFGIAGGCLAVVLALFADTLLDGAMIDGRPAVTSETGEPASSHPVSAEPQSRRDAPVRRDADSALGHDLSTVPTEQLLDELARNPLNSLEVSAFGRDCNPGPAPDRPSGTQAFADYLSRLRDTCLSPAWTAAAADAGFDAPGFTIQVITSKDEPSPPGCRGGESGSPAWFCEVDGRIYVMSDWGGLQKSMVDANPPLAYAEVLSHENAHVMQFDVFGMGPIVSELTRRDDEAGVDTTSHRVEMQAQCLAQASMKDAVGDYRQPLANAAIEGDMRNWQSDEEHGSARNQALWAGRGARSHGDLSVCNTWAAPDAEVR